MPKKIQQSEIRPLQTSHTSKNINNSSGKVTIAANRLQNDNKKCPVAAKQTVNFSESSQIKAFSNEEALNKVSKTQTLTILTKTEKKTVHNKDIKNLKNNISENLSLISIQIKKIGTSDGRGGKVTLPRDTMNKFNSILSNLKDNIQNYKNELGRSTYLHNSNKEKALSRLEDKLHNTAEKFKKSEGKNSYLSRNSSLEQTKNTFTDAKQRREDYKNENGNY